MISHSVAASSSLVHESRGTDDRKLKRKVVIISGQTTAKRAAVCTVREYHTRTLQQEYPHRDLSLAEGIM